MIFDEKDLNYAYESLEKLRNGESCSWNGVGWDGNPENSFAWDCVYEAIWKDIDEYQESIAE